MPFISILLINSTNPEAINFMRHGLWKEEARRSKYWNEL